MRTFKLYPAWERIIRMVVIPGVNDAPGTVEMQLESLSFDELDADTFMRQIYKFQKDPHMKIEKIDFQLC